MVKAVQVLTAASVVAAAGAGAAAAEPQPGTTTPPSNRPQPGTTTPAPEPTLTPPARPDVQSPLGNAIPDPVQRAPEEYRPSPSQQSGWNGNSGYSGGGSGNSSGGESGNAGNWNGGGGQSAPQTSLNEDLSNLHAPQPVPDPPKTILPPAPDKLGVGDAYIDRPDWLPPDVAWKFNGHAAEAQREVDTFLNSVGFSPDRSTRMGTGIVAGASLGAVAGATALGVPAAVAGGVAGGLIGGTVGGIAGAAAGTLIPVPGIGTVTSGVAGTAVGAAAGAAIGAAAVGVPAALAGGAAGGVLGGTVGAIVTAGDGSDFTPPPEGATTPEKGTAPSLHDQFRQAVTNATAAGEQAVDWVEAQPGGAEALDSAVTAAQDLGGRVDAATQPWGQQLADASAQVASEVVTAAKADPATAEVATAAADVLSEQQPFAPGQLGALTDAANGALAGLQAAVLGQ